MPGTCHATCPDGERGLGFQSPWAGSLDLPSDKERCEVSWGRDGGQPSGRGCFFVCFVLSVPGASGFLWLLPLGPLALFFSTLQGGHLGSKNENRPDQNFFSEVLTDSWLLAPVTCWTGPLTVTSFQFLRKGMPSDTGPILIHSMVHVCGVLGAWCVVAFGR